MAGTRASASGGVSGTRGVVWRFVVMAAGGSDPRAGDVEEDASQLIFPKGGAGAARLPPLSRVVAANLASPRASPEAAADSWAGSRLGDWQGGWGMRPWEGPGPARLLYL